MEVILSSSIVRGIQLCTDNLLLRASQTCSMSQYNFFSRRKTRGDDTHGSIPAWPPKLPLSAVSATESLAKPSPSGGSASHKSVELRSPIRKRRRKVLVAGVLAALKVTEELSGPLPPLQLVATALVKVIEIYQVRPQSSVLVTPDSHPSNSPGEIYRSIAAIRSR